ncbi:VOC family protein [Pararhodobacter oceanensis]|uniref:VOC family protein n=1 Tax=Pararhodobacter oceanensis TaxID=2172121 RepID=UPI003A92AD98
MAVFDHLAIAAETLREGVEYVEALLGVPLEAGGEHPLMGTHNALLSLGPEAYLEVIAINPEMAAPAHRRWFALDEFTGPPRLRAWIAATDDLDAALARAPEGAGRAVELARGDLAWRMAVPEDGRLPFDGVFPALIQWRGAAHPAQRLPDRGVRLTGLTLQHPRGAELGAALGQAVAPLDREPWLELRSGAAAMTARFETPQGTRELA